MAKSGRGDTPFSSKEGHSYWTAVPKPRYPKRREIKLSLCSQDFFCLLNTLRVRLLVSSRDFAIYFSMTVFLHGDHDTKTTKVRLLLAQLRAESSALHMRQLQNQAEAKLGDDGR